MLEDTGVCLHGETCEPRYPQTRIAQELTHEEFVATGGSSTWGMVLEVQGLIRQGGSEHRGVTDREDSVERLRVGVVYDMLRSFLRSFETQGQGPVLPGIVQHMTAITPQDRVDAQLLRCLHELTRFVPGGGKEEHETRASPVRCSHNTTSN